MPTNRYICYGAEWIKMVAPDKKMSEFGQKIANIWAAIWQGTYHNPGPLLRADLSKQYVVMTVDTIHDWSTYDNEILMALIVLCYEENIRLQINACSPTHIKMSFSQRYHSDTDLFEGIPTLEEHITSIRDRYIIKG